MKRPDLPEPVGTPEAIQDGRPEAARVSPRRQSYIEESFAYAAYCASTVKGVERVCYEEFLRRWPRD